MAAQGLFLKSKEAPELEVHESRLLDVPLLKICGEVDHWSAPALEQAMQSACGDKVLLDLTECRYLDSGGLGVILSAVQESSAGGGVGVIGPNADVRRLFEIVGLVSSPGFWVFDTSEAAESQLPSEHS
jgi:anti-sigma B factor antagonist